MQDALYQTFEKHLMSLDIEKETHSEFIANVVEEYFQILQGLGHICFNYEIELRDEIELEVITMLRKKIYGHFDLDHYLHAKRSVKYYTS